MYETILTLLGISEPTEQVEQQINTIISITENRLKLLINEKPIPDELKYIVVEVAVKRYNRLGSEGLASHSVEGESMTWSDNDFKDYQSDISLWLSNQEEPPTNRGRIRFI